MTQREAHVIILKLIECYARSQYYCNGKSCVECTFNSNRKDIVKALNIASDELTKITGKLNLVDELQQEEK